MGRRRDRRIARALLDALALPDPPDVVHVVGTNGKGTVCHAVAAMATAAGRVAGRFTSPHVERVGERVAVDGTELGDDEVRAFASRARDLVAAGVGTDAGFFEWTLALALETFARTRVTLAVLEAGVGARDDATSAVGGVRVGVLTNVALDHQATLGTTLEAIAEEKSAVVRPGVPVVTAATGVALDVVRRAATDRGAELVARSDGDPRFDLPEPLRAAPLGPPTHREDLEVACAVGRVLGLGEAALEAGCRAPAPPARFERFAVGGVDVVLDGAHDPAAAAALAAALPAGYVLVFGALDRKQGRETFAPLAGRASFTVATVADADEPSVLVDADERVPHPEEALARAVARAGTGGVVVVAGSLHLAGRIRPLLRSAASSRTGVVGGRW